MSYHHLTTFERGRIQELLSLGYSHRHIAQKLHRHRSCIDRELLRNATSNSYAGEAAQSAYETRRKSSVPKGKCTDDLVAIIEDKLLATWSPEQIANTVTLGLASFKTIYNWLYSGKLTNTSITVLRQKGKRRKAEMRGKFSMGTPISERPKEVKSRATFGHWELDSMVSSRGESKGCFATFVERKSRLYTAFKTPDRTAVSMQTAITQTLQHTANRCIQNRNNRPGKRVCLLYGYSRTIGINLIFC